MVLGKDFKMYFAYVEGFSSIVSNFFNGGSFVHNIDIHNMKKLQIGQQPGYGAFSKRLPPSFSGKLINPGTDDGPRQSRQFKGF